MSLDGLTQRQILLGVLVLAVVASLTGVAVAVLTGTAAHGGRGGAVAVALSFAALFAGRNTPEALLRDRTEDGRVAIEVEPCEQRIRRLHGAINVMIDSQRQEKRYLTWSSVIGTVFWGFGDEIARWLILWR